MTLAWTPDPERIRRLAGQRLMAAAVLLQAEHKRDLSRLSNPAPHRTPAPRGTWPAGRTWNLRDSVAIDPADLNEIVKSGRVRVGLLKNAFYGNVLAVKGWKGLLDTLDRVRGQVVAILTGGR